MARPRVRRVFRPNVRHGVVVTLVAGAVAATAFGYLSAASAGPPEVLPIDVWTLHDHHGQPVAGQLFEGLAFVNRSGVLGTPEPFSFVRCDAEIAGKRVNARQLTFGHAVSGDVQVVICGWHIPADTGGKKLRLWDY